jgi:4-hydroxy-4-methyl-2-oxoglutarate aldolase
LKKVLLLESMKTNVLVKEIKRPPTEIIESFKDIPVANIADALGKPSSFTIDPSITPAFNGIRLLGSALTVKEKPGCNLMTHAAINIAEEGDVIVIDAESHLAVATGGFLMSRKMIHKGVNGVVIEGAWRDKAEIMAAGFPVYCKGWQPTGPNKEHPGSVNVPIQCGGVVVNPGDIVVGDDDGVIIIPQNIAEETACEARKIMEREGKTMKEARKEIITAPSPYALPERLKELGVDIR